MHYCPSVVRRIFSRHRHLSALSLAYPAPSTFYLRIYSIICWWGGEWCVEKDLSQTTAKEIPNRTTRKWRASQQRRSSEDHPYSEDTSTIQLRERVHTNALHHTRRTIPLNLHRRTSPIKKKITILYASLSTPIPTPITPSRVLKSKSKIALLGYSQIQS